MRTNKYRARVAAGLMLTVAVLAGCSPLTEHTSTAEYIKPGQVAAGGYKTAETYIGDFKISYVGDARFFCTKRENLTWENAGDRYNKVLVENYQQVKKGDPLVTFYVESVSDADILEKELAIEEAYAASQATIRRYDELIAAKMESMAKMKDYDYEIAALELEKLRSEYAQQMAEAERQVQTQQNALDELMEKKNQDTLVAPFDGRITMISNSIVQGNKVEPNQTLITIEDTNSQVIEFTNTSAFGKVPYKGEVTMTNRRTKETFTGTVVSCSGVTGDENDRVIVQPDQPVSEDAERMAFFDATGLLVNKTNVLLVSSEAIKEEGNSHYVYVLDENNTTMKVYVEVGGINEGVAWVSDGLEPGQTVLRE